jgi:hypothetical protein
MNGLLKNVNHYVLVIGLMTKKLIHAIVSILVLNMSIMILLLKLVFLGTLLLNAQDQDSLMVLIVNVKFQVLFGLKKNSGVFVKLMTNS